MNKTLLVAIGLTLQILLIKPAIADDKDWTDRIKFSGDLRLRYEGIDEEFEEERNRMRYRARFGFSAEVQDNVKIVVRLATGGDNPVSTNQTFDDGFSTKDIRLDLGYVDWTVSDALSISAGKMKNPLFRAGKAPLIWDGDLNPEGIAATYSEGLFFATLAAFSIEERSSTDDSLLYAAQGGVKLAVGENTKLTAGVGYFTYTNTVGNEPFYNGRSNGNSVDANGDYLFDYENIEIFAQYDTKLNDWPVQLFAQYTQNKEVSAEDTGIAFGARVGSLKSEGDMEFAVIYEETEADAVIGTFNDSDFAGGSTDADGFILRARYALSKKISLGGTFFVNDADRSLGTEHDYNRVQIDLAFKFD